jgi:hypothetical protein
MSNLPPNSLLSTATLVEDEQALQQNELIRCLLVTVQHFFNGFRQLFGNVYDPRHPAFITYPLPALLTTGVLMFLLRLGARRQITLMLRQNGPSWAKFKALFCVETCPTRPLKTLIGSTISNTSIPTTTLTLFLSSVVWKPSQMPKVCSRPPDSSGSPTSPSRSST